MTLREEITEILTILVFTDVFPVNEMTTKILKLVEKEIDKLYDKTNYIDAADLLYSDIKEMLR